MYHPYQKAYGVIFLSLVMNIFRAPVSREQIAVMFANLRQEIAPDEEEEVDKAGEYEEMQLL